MMRLAGIASVLYFLLVFSCSTSESVEVKDGDSGATLFTLLKARETGVDFINQLTEDWQHNIFTYDYFYNGGGVAIGDINNDGLPDLFFTGNQVSNKLYLNKGDLKFENITESAGISGEGGWSTGIAVADVNTDGFLDIYVCRSFSDDDDKMRENLLYINNGDLTFSERGAEFGVNDSRYSITAVFLDYDLDGDLDLYVGNFPRDMLPDPRDRIRNWKNPILKNSNKLYVNNKGKFTDQTEAAGLLTRRRDHPVAFEDGLAGGLNLARSSRGRRGYNERCRDAANEQGMLHGLSSPRVPY